MSAVRDDEETYLHEEIQLNLVDDPGSDDTEASELDIGGELDDVLAEHGGDNEPIELDLGTMVDLDEKEGSSSDEPDGEISMDPTLGLDVPEALLPDDGSEGVEDTDIVVDESKFPELVSDDGSEGIAAEREIVLGVAGDEARLPLAAVPYLVDKPKTALEACAALTARGKSVVVASSDLLWFRADETTPLRLAIDGSALADIALTGPQEDVVIAATRAGMLFRRARFASQAEQLVRFREFARAGSGRAAFSFGAAHAEGGSSLYVATPDGTLLRVLEAGERFERVELAGKVVSLAHEGSAAIVLDAREARLVFLGAEGGPIPLTGAALDISRSEAPLLAAAERSLALAAPVRAIVVSQDGGRTFRSVAGTASATALAGANDPSGARFYAALYRETSDETDIVVIDPERAEAQIVARISGTDGAEGDTDPADRAEWARVARLAWHAESGALWAVGGFGVLRLARPSS